MALFKNRAERFRSIDPNYKAEVKEEENKAQYKDGGSESINTNTV